MYSPMCTPPHISLLHMKARMKSCNASKTCNMKIPLKMHGKELKISISILLINFFYTLQHGLYLAYEVLVLD